VTVRTKLIVSSLTNEKAETIISTYINDTLEKLLINTKCVAFSGNNKNANFGSNILTFFKDADEENKTIQDASIFLWRGWC